ncbi:MAG: hypothetical protein KBA15_04580 [Spirochaetes bacterium]|nr:hypothetical protein [Spirochaetota bacterium]
MTATPSPIDFREEILNCLIEHSARVSTTASAGDARRSLEEAFRESKGDYRNPDYRSLLEAMKRLAVREMGTGKDMRTISNNFMAIARKIKAAEYRLLSGISRGA